MLIMRSELEIMLQFSKNYALIKRTPKSSILSKFWGTWKIFNRKIFKIFQKIAQRVNVYKISEKFWQNLKNHVLASSCIVDYKAIVSNFEQILWQEVI